MRRYLVVANQALQAAELREELRKRIEAGSSSFYVLVPNTSAAHYHVVPAPGGAIPPGMEAGPRRATVAPPPTRRRAHKPGNGSTRCWPT